MVKTVSKLLFRRQRRSSFQFFAKFQSFPLARETVQKVFQMFTVN